MFGMFDIISVLYASVTVVALWQLIKNWHSFWDDFVSPRDWHLAAMLAVFVFIPIGVFLHELGHAAAIWMLGGTVGDFEWRVFWGYVVPLGSFTAVEYWWIALSGNLVSIFLGLLAILGFARLNKPILRVVLLFFAQFQLIFALLIYPVFSFTGFSGDWVRIYDFSVTPYAQITLVLHILLLYVVWHFFRITTLGR